MTAWAASSLAGASVIVVADPSSLSVAGASIAAAFQAGKQRRIDAERMINTPEGG
jgi:hypothetical protein